MRHLSDETPMQPLKLIVMLEKTNEEKTSPPPHLYTHTHTLMLENPAKRNYCKRLNLVLKVKYPVTAEETN